MGEEADADWDAGLVEWGIEDTRRSMCPIEDPHFCLGARCQVTGICDYNRRHRRSRSVVSAPGERQ